MPDEKTLSFISIGYARNICIQMTSGTGPRRTSQYYGERSTLKVQCEC